MLRNPGPWPDRAYVLFLSLALWGIHLVWLAKDTRPPVWDMALHQTYALNYVQPEGRGVGPFWVRSGNYPPFVHIAIALAYKVMHPGPHVAVLANFPATLLLFWAIYQLALDLAGRTAARWAAFLTSLTPYLLWMSRETILDYWLSAWVAGSLLLLMRSEGFGKRRPALLLGVVMGFGMLTKWLLAGFLLFPILYVGIRHKIWKDRMRLIHCADALLIAVGLAAIWYLPNFARLLPYFMENSRIGAREGEPPVFSFQGWIYYLRLLEGYQLFAPLFVLVAVGIVLCWRRGLMKQPAFLAVAIVGGWLVMSLIRTKDPRFTMPLLGPLLIFAAAWIQSWAPGLRTAVLKSLLAGFLMLQAYAVNFGISALPDKVVLLRGYQGALSWDWNLYMQDYFGILGPPRRENWRQQEILRSMDEHSRARGLRRSLAVLPDLARFNAANFQLYARLLGIRARIDHPQRGDGLRALDGFDYVLMTEGDQGMSWTTGSNRALNQRIVDDPQMFRLIELFLLPNRDAVRLYYVEPGDR